MSSSHATLIIGATGKQGGAALAALLKDGKQNLRILTRNPDSPKVRKLAEKGVKVFKGDLTDAASLAPALEGATSAFLMTTPMGAAHDGETKQGTTFVDVAVKAGLQHLVFTSVADSDKADFVPHFHAKYVVEEYIKQSGLSYTILRPVAFMDNFPLSGPLRFASLGLFSTILGARKLQYIAVEDIGIIAARALENPEKWGAKTIHLSGDELDMGQLLDTYQKVDGGVRPWKAWIPNFMLRLLPYDFRMMIKFFREPGYSKSVEAMDLMRSIYPGVMNFEQWLVKEKQRLVKDKQRKSE